MKTFEKLRLKIEKDLGLKLHNFQRMYVGRHQRGSGSFVWTAECIESMESVGSGTTATDLLKQGKITQMETPTICACIELI